MKISFENPDKINGLLTLVVEEEDYKNDVEKTLKDYRKKANVPGFRPGQAPMGMIKRQFGASVKMEAINKLVGQEIYKYVQDNNIQMLGEPLPSEKQEPADLEKDTTFTFMFDIAVAPEFKVTLNGRDKVDYYNIKVDDKILDQQGGVETIRPYVEEFIIFAHQHPDLHFLVTPIGCGIAGFEAEDIAPLFESAKEMKNISLPESFWEVIE